MNPLRTKWKSKKKFASANELWKGHFASFSKELPPSPSSSSLLAPPPPPSNQSAQPPQIFNSVPCLTGRDRTNYLLVKEAKIIAMTCTHAALKRRDLVELGFKVKKSLYDWFSIYRPRYILKRVFLLSFHKLCVHVHVHKMKF